MSKKSRIGSNSKVTRSIFEPRVRNLKGLEPKDLVSLLLSKPSLNREQRRIVTKYGVSGETRGADRDALSVAIDNL